MTNITKAQQRGITRDDYHVPHIAFGSVVMRRQPVDGLPATAFLRDCLSVMPGALEPGLCSRLASEVSAVVDAQRGETLAHTGAPMRALYLLASGACKSVMLGEDGVQQVVYFYWPRELMELNALAGRHFVTDVVAIATSRLYEIPLAGIERLGQDSPDVLESLLSHVSERLAEAERSQYMLGSLRSAQRLAFVFADTLQRVRRDGDAPLLVPMPMRRSELASYLGLAPETVSRLIAWFEEQGIIRALPGHVVEVLAQQRLHDLLRHDAGRSPLSRPPTCQPA